ncbi:putative FHA domain-containing protein PS1 [Cocos nucifera]|nr:putative FHA domain-containing protein PS1 [Cocos nucifera]
MSFEAEEEVGVKKDNGALSEKDKQEETMGRAVPDDLGGKEKEKEEETFGSDKENMTPMGSISQKSKSKCPDLWRASSIVSTYLNVEEDVFHSDMENWRPEVLRDLKLNEPTYENVVKSERDDEMFGSDKENLTSGISSDEKMKEKSYKMLQRSPFNTITASNVVDSDKENRTPEISREMKSKQTQLWMSHDD